MKKFLLGLLCGAILMASTAVYASDTIKAYLFPVDFKINEQVKVLDKEYTGLNYNGHAYVPIRFVAENLGAYVSYDEASSRININYFPRNSAFLTDNKYPNVHVGVIQLAADGKQTLFKGMVTVDSDDSNQNTVQNLDFTLNFYDETNMLLGTFNWRTNDKPLKSQEIRYILDSFSGDATKYSKVSLEVTKQS